MHKSNFYSTLLREPKIEKFSTTKIDAFNNQEGKEKIVERKDFKYFIFESKILEPIYEDNARIEVVSPVLVSSEAKWRGIFESKYISFNLNDSDFKNSVINKDISFSNGTSIKCTIEIKREMDENGIIKNIEYNVFNVTETFQGSVSNLTNKGKKQIAAKNQTKLDLE